MLGSVGVGLLVQVNLVCFLYLVWDEVCNRASGNIIRKRAIQITGTVNLRGHKREKRKEDHSGQELVRNARD